MNTRSRKPVIIFPWIRHPAGYDMDAMEKIKKGWQRWLLFKEFEPGHRFQTRYSNKRQRRERGETSRYVRLLNVIGGPALIVAGFAFLPTPGPSYIIIVIGLWMLAGEFLPLARFFDRTEVRLRSFGSWVKGVWVRSSRVMKALVLLVILACVGALAYWLFF